MSSPAPVVYLSHAITLPIQAGCWASHVGSVQRLAAALVKKGYSVIIPPLLDESVSHEEALKADRELVRRSDLLVIHDSPYVKDSTGIARELTWARKLKLPVYAPEQNLTYGIPTARQFKRCAKK